MPNKSIGFWKNGEFGYLSSPIAYKNGEAIRMRLVRNRYASKERNTPTYIAYIDNENFRDMLNNLEEKEEASWEPSYDPFWGSVYPPEGYKCSGCGFKNPVKSEYCPNCGACMD